MARSVLQASNALKRLYAGNTSSGFLDRAQLFAALAKRDDNKKDKNAVYNVLSTIRGHGLIDTDYDPENHAIRGVSLTDKGRQVLGLGMKEAIARAQVEPAALPKSLELAPRLESPGVISLQLITELTDEFNRQNPSWEWRLVRKGEAI